jgi:signal transduction histidine kinase
MPPRPLRDAAATAVAALAPDLPAATLLVTVHDGDDGVLRVVAAHDGAGLGAEPGTAVPLDDAFCSYMVADVAPRVSGDVTDEPVHGGCAVRNGLGVRSYAGVPIELAGGRRVGSVCALSRRTDAFSADDEAALATAAAGLAAELAGDEHASDDRAGALRAEARAVRRRAGFGRLAGPLPFAGAILLGFASVPLPPAHPTVVWALLAASGLAALIAASLAVVRWERLGPVVRMVPAYALFLVVALLRHAEGGTTSGLAVLVLLPVLWVALHGNRRELGVAVAGVALTLLIPPIVAGAPAYPLLELRRGVISTAVSLLLGAAVQGVVALARARRDELLQRARDLHAAEEQKRLILATAGEGILGLDPDLRVTFANPAAASLTGFAPDALVGRPLGELLVEADPQTRAGRIRRADGTTFPVDRTTRPLRRDGRLAGAVVTFADVTERRRVEQMKEEFFALVSHELRTPLTSIVGYLEVLLEEDAEDDLLPPHQRRFLGTIDRNARRLQRLVGDLLFVAQLEAGRLALEPGDAALDTLAGEAVAAARPRADERGVELVLAAGPVRACPGDAERLGQVLDNLVSNAVKFTPRGGRVVVRVGEDREAVWAEVQDTGIGIPPEEVDLLFDRFFRASSATEREIPGVGLGLAVAKAIAEGHGGGIAVDSTEGRGTTFRVTLPAPAEPVALAA